MSKSDENSPDTSQLTSDDYQMWLEVRRAMDDADYHVRRHFYHNKAVAQAVRSCNAALDMLQEFCDYLPVVPRSEVTSEADNHDD